MPFVKKLFAASFAILVLVLFIAAKWSFTPARNDMRFADNAVTHLNSRIADKVFVESYFQHRDQTLHYVEAGNGEVVLFLHGFPSYWYSFSRQMQSLVNDYRVVAIDGLGAGKSDAPIDPEYYKLENMSAHLNALIEHLGADKVHLVGHDWGSAFAFGFAQRYPERVSTVTGISAPAPNVMLATLQSDEVLRDMASYIERLKQANPLLISLLGADRRVWEGAYKPLVAKGLLSPAEGNLFRNATGNPKRIDAHINWYRANIPAPDAIDGASFWPSRDARLTMPVQIIWGEDDRVFSASYIDGMKAIADNVHSVRLEKTGHWPHVEKSDLVTRAILRLLDETDPNRTILPEIKPIIERALDD